MSVIELGASSDRRGTGTPREPGRQDRLERGTLRPAPRLAANAVVLRARRPRGRGVKPPAAWESSETTATRILRRCGLSRRGRLEAPRVVARYEHAAVGDMLHVDTKKLGRIRYLGHRATGQRRGQRHGSGWECVHVAVDDRSRVAYVELLPDERGDTARGFVRRALAWFRARGVRVRRILTDNGPCYRVVRVS